jgi:archaellum component FlaC
MEKEIESKICDVHKEIYGNGDSSKSMVSRIAKLETTIKVLTSLSISQFFILISIAMKVFMGG